MKLANNNDCVNFLHKSLILIILLIIGVCIAIGIYYYKYHKSKTTIKQRPPYDISQNPLNMDAINIAANSINSNIENVEKKIESNIPKSINISLSPNNSII